MVDSWGKTPHLGAGFFSKKNHKKEKKQLDKEVAAWYYKQAVARSMESTGSGSGVPCKLNNGKHVKNTKDNFGEESCSERCQ